MLYKADVQPSRLTNGSSTLPTGNRPWKRWLLLRPIRTLPRSLAQSSSVSHLLPRLTSTDTRVPSLVRGREDCRLVLAPPALDTRPDSILCICPPAHVSIGPPDCHALTQPKQPASRFLVSTVRFQIALCWWRQRVHWLAQPRTVSWSGRCSKGKDSTKPNFGTWYPSAF
jgi:hypothetical protein